MTKRNYPCLPILLLVWCLSDTALAQAGRQPITIGLFGDTAYSQRERELLPELIAEMDSEDLAFVIHDGDIKSGGSVCSDEVFLDRFGVFKASRHPLVYVPGTTNGPTATVEALAHMTPLNGWQNCVSSSFPPT